MKFGLKTYLFTLCGVGAVVGVMGRLLLVRPEAFLQVLSVASTIVPFLLAIGTIIWLGLRKNRDWRIVLWGVFLVFVPLAIYFSLLLLWPTRNPLRVLTTQRLLEQRLPTQMDQPWVWNELAYRLNNKRLSQADVNDAVQQLTAHIKKSSPSGANRPLVWEREFLTTATQAKMVSENVLLGLCDAMFGTQPKVRPISPVAARQRGFRVHLEFGNPWTHNLGLGVERLWQVNQVLVDGSPAKVLEENRFGDDWAGFLDNQLPRGGHEVEFEIECAYVNDDEVLGNVARLPVEQWPRARKRWKTTVTAPVEKQ